jgi:prepilin signal peptidase PulO-like enzyme (type II secretory pathway)
MLQEEIIRYILLGLAIFLGWLAGNGSVFLFNKLPGKWLTDYHETPLEEVIRPTRQRIGSMPWKLVYSMFFMASGIWIAEKLWQSSLAPWSMVALLISYIIAMWLLLLIGLADGKFGIIPDELVFVLALTAIGFAPYKDSFLDPLYGALIGGGSMLILSLISKAITKKPALGMGDVKLFLAIGLIMGFQGTISILVVTAISSAVGFSAGLLIGTLKRGDSAPLGPYIVGATYLIILFDGISEFILGGF